MGFRTDGLDLFYNDNFVWPCNNKKTFHCRTSIIPMIISLLLLFHTLTLILNMLNGMFDLAICAKIEWEAS